MSDKQDLKLGQIITGVALRDAIHIAVAPVRAGHTLNPGQHVGFLESNQEVVGDSSSPIGIVDPFLTSVVLRGQSCWMFLYPNTITGLRHEWTHPAFSAVVTVSADKAASEAWLRDFCARSDCPGYDVVMRAAQGYFQEDDDDDYSSGGYIDDHYMHFSGRDAHGDIPPEFWIHAEIVLGQKLEQKPPSFSCSC